MTRREFVPLMGLPGLAQTPSTAASNADWRNIRNGHVIPDEGYADQPYIVLTDDGHWLCVITTGKGVEGEGGQHVVALRSADKGRTWSAPIDIEPAAGPEASWIVPVKVPSGRIYVVYTYNRDNIRTVPEVANPGIAKRVDTLGVFALKYSDDHGRTWSRRYEIPQRSLPSDQDNNFGGKQIFFWSVCKPLIDRGQVFIGFARISRWGTPGVLVRSRGFVLRSDNMVSERDPAKLRWLMLPESDEGLRAPKGPISEETNLVSLSDGTLFAVYRTIDGYLCQAYSRDRGRTWTAPEYATFAPGGRPIKNPRAFAFVRRFSNGKYLLWFHNQGGEAVHLREKWDYYRDRNPGWVCGGEERGGRIHWSEPELLLYDDDPAMRISYPDFIEDKGRYFVSETQKSVARVHEIDRKLLDAVWGKPTVPAALTQDPLTLSASTGFALDGWILFKDLTPGQVIADTRDSTGKGVALLLSDRFSLKLILNDGRVAAEAESDCGTHQGTLKAAVWQHFAAIVDAGPKVITFVIDGVFNDGGAIRQFGWTRYNPALGDLTGSSVRTSSPHRVHFYGRPLLTAEAIALHRMGRARAERTNKY